MNQRNSDFFFLNDSLGEYLKDFIKKSLEGMLKKSMEKLLNEYVDFYFWYLNFLKESKDENLKYFFEKLLEGILDFFFEKKTWKNIHINSWKKNNEKPLVFISWILKNSWNELQYVFFKEFPWLFFKPLLYKSLEKYLGEFLM